MRGGYIHLPILVQGSLERSFQGECIPQAQPSYFRSRAARQLARGSARATDAFLAPCFTLMVSLWWLQ